VTNAEKQALLEWIDQFQKSVELALIDQRGNRERIVRKIAALRHIILATWVDNPRED